MKIAAVIAEYNPFHNGHRYQILQMRKAGYTHIVAVMSGNFVQRGDAALLEKRTRAKAALLCGVDLVVELPLPYALATAERFAYGGVALAEALGCVDTLFFGSEAGTLAPLQAVAELLESPALYVRVREICAQQGITFARARQRAVQDFAGADAAELLASPNNILAIEYLRKLYAFSSSIQPYTLPREGAAHHGQAVSGRFASASVLRGWADTPKKMQPFLPRRSFAVLEQAFAASEAPASLPIYERQLLAVLRQRSAEALCALPDLSEGIENRLAAAILCSSSYGELLDKLKTKRYALSRVRRLVLSAYLQIPSDFCNQPPPYLRILGMNTRGKEVLALAKRTATLPLSHSLSTLARSSSLGGAFARLESASTDAYSLLIPSPAPCATDFTQKCIVACSPRSYYPPI